MITANEAKRNCARVKLTINEAKSAVASTFGGKFLGYSFWVASDGVVKRAVADKPLTTFKQRVRQLTRRSCGRSMQDVVNRPRPYLFVWKACFRLAQTPKVCRKLDEGVRHRLRAIQLRQRKRGRSMYRVRLAPHPASRVRWAANSRRWSRNSGMLLNSVPNLAWFDRLGPPRLS